MFKTFLLLVYLFCALIGNSQKQIPALDKYISSYAFVFDLNGVVLVVKNDKIIYNKAHRKVELIPESENKYFIDEPDIDIQFQFIRNNKNNITGLFLFEGGVRSEFKKVN